MTISELKERHGVNAPIVSKRFKVPFRTAEKWFNSGNNHCEPPEYIVLMMDEILKAEKNQKKL